MWSDISRFVLRLFRVGLVRAVLAADAVILAIIGFDLWHFVTRGYDPGAVFAQIPLLSASHIGRFVNVLLCSAIALPLLCATLRLFLNRKSRHHGRLANPLSTMGILVHIVLSFTLAAVALFTPLLDRLGGLSYDLRQQDFRPSVESYFGVLSDVAATGLGLLASFAGVLILPPLLVFLSRQVQPSRYVQDLLSKLVLLDLRGDLYPHPYSPSRANFAAGAISPEIRMCRRVASAIVDHYNALGTGSPQATNYLAEVANECSRLAKRLLFEGADLTKLNLAYTSSTSRALQICLLRLGSRRVILSPFEHPSERKAVEWLQHVGVVDPVHLPQGKDLLDAPASSIAGDVAVLIADALDSAKEDSVVVLSDVCWVTGTRVPTKRIIERVKGLTSKPFRLVVDGAHAVGNNGIVDLSLGFDAYVFGGHKWLFSTAVPQRFTGFEGAAGVVSLAVSTRGARGARQGFVARRG